MELNYVIKRPVQSEKANFFTKSLNCYVFHVHPKANKFEIKQAIEELFDVEVKDVNIVRRRPLQRERQGRVVGRMPGWKKAYVKLAHGSKIDLFEV